MNEVIQQLLYFSASYIGIILVFFIGVNFLTKGFLLTYLSAKFSRGRKMLVRIHSLSDIYFKANKVSDKKIEVKDRNGEKHMLTIDQSQVYHTMGIASIDYDEVSNEVVKIDGERTPGLDPVRAQNLVIRAIDIGRRTANKGKEKIIFIVSIITLGVCVLTLYFVYQLLNGAGAVATSGVIS